MSSDQFSPEALSQSLPGAVLGQVPHYYGVRGGQGPRGTAANATAADATDTAAGVAAGARAAHRSAAHQGAAHADSTRSTAPAAADGPHASGT